MKKLTYWLKLKSDDELFQYFVDNLKLKGITQWDYFVKWDKVYANVIPFERELNLLTKDGYPDWQFMEYYIKHLPYSKNLEEDKQKSKYEKDN